VAPERKRASAVEEVRRRQIMESTVAVVAEVGFAGASLAAIAQHAGLSKGLLSYHFRDKDHLMEQTALWTFASFEHAIVDGLDQELLVRIDRQGRGRAFLCVRSLGARARSTRPCPARRIYHPGREGRKERALGSRVDPAELTCVWLAATLPRKAVPSRAGL